MANVDDESRRKHAFELVNTAYREQLSGNLEEAIRLYEASIACWPTAEGHSFLGWSLSVKGDLDAAIAECKKAIDLDPDFGNPYNDIGSYLIHQGKVDDALPWLERALQAKRYEPRHYPHCNLGRVYQAKGMLMKAIEEYEKALAIAPDYEYARQALADSRAQLN